MKREFEKNPNRNHPRVKQRFLKKIKDLQLLAKDSFENREEYEERNIAFEVYGDNRDLTAENYRYRVIMSDRRDIDLNSYEAKYFHAGYTYILTYDGQLEAYEVELRLTPPFVELSANRRMGGFFSFRRFGQSQYRITVENSALLGKEEIDVFLCYIVKYQPPNEDFFVKLWVDLKKQFYIRKREIYKDGKLGSSISYNNFEQTPEGIWYPMKSNYVTFDKEGKLVDRISIIVKEVLLNVDFPDDFFAVDTKEIVDRLRITESSPIKLQKDKKLTSNVDRGPKSLFEVCKEFGIETNLQELSELSGLDPVKGTTMRGLYCPMKEK